MTVKGLEITVNEGSQMITLNSPHTRNAFNQEIYEAITDALNTSAQNDAIVSTIITGAGEYFSSGTSLAMDTTIMEGSIENLIDRSSKVLGNFVSAIVDYPKLLIAVVNGPALGIAVTILGLCDVVFASDKATFQTPFMKLGLCPEACSSYTFPRIMGTAKAGQMLFLGYKMKAEEACQCGLVSNVFEHFKLNDILRELQKVGELPKKSLMCAKELIRGWDKEQLHKVRITEGIQLAERFKSDEFMMAMINFANKKRSKL